MISDPKVRAWLKPSLKNKVLSENFNVKMESGSKLECEDDEVKKVKMNLEESSDLDSLASASERNKSPLVLDRCGPGGLRRKKLEIEVDSNADDSRTNDNVSEKWNKILRKSTNTHRQRTKSNLYLETESQGSNTNSVKKKLNSKGYSSNFDFSSMNTIGEAHQMSLAAESDKFFLQESHSIIPFLLITNKEIHRICISDFEIKQNETRFKKKVEYQNVCDRDYYHKGLINFYLGNYQKAFETFNNGHKLFPENINLTKWLAFTCIVLIFCEKSVDFSRIASLKIIEDSNERQSDSSSYSFCVLRKADMKIDNVIRDRTYYCQICEELLEKLVSNGRTQIEAWWMNMIIGIYCKLNFFQNLFTDPFDPIFCVKQIKISDQYLGYLSFNEYRRIMDSDNYNPHEFYNDLINLYPKRFEGYYSYWQLLVKGRYKDLKKAFNLAEKLWCNCFDLKLDHINSFITFMIYAKSYFLIGKSYYALNLFQNKYLVNLHYPAFYYLLGKYLAKTDIKEGLRHIAISTLSSVYPLLFEDLQKSVLFYIGEIYYNSGSIRETFEYWKRFSFINEKTAGNSIHKAAKANSFFCKNEGFCMRFIDFVKYVQTYKIHENHNDNDTDLNVGKLISDLTMLKNRVPNIRENYAVTYEYLKGLIQLYASRSRATALKNFSNIINKNGNFMPAHQAIWDLIKLTGDFRFLLKFSLFSVKVAHSNEVELCHWINAYYNYSKALVLNDENEDAIKILQVLLENYASIKLDDIKYLKSVYKEFKIGHTTEFQSYDEGLKFYSKKNVFEKIEDIFKKHHKNVIRSKKLYSDKILISVDQSDHTTHEKSKTHKDSLPSNQNNELNDNEFLENLGLLDTIQNSSVIININNYCATEPQYLHTVDELNSEGLVENTESRLGMCHTMGNENMKKDDILSIDESLIEKEDYNSECSMIDLDITDINNFEKLIDRQLENFSVNFDHPFLHIITDSKILYHIGKLSAISQSNYQLGASCLQEFIKLIAFENNYVSNEETELKKSRAFFWLAIIHMNLGELNKTEYIFQIILQNEINLNFKKMNLIHQFMDTRKAITYSKSYFL